jgi:hypothetical protein
MHAETARPGLGLAMRGRDERRSRKISPLGLRTVGDCEIEPRHTQPPIPIPITMPPFVSVPIRTMHSPLLVQAHPHYDNHPTEIARQP